MWCGPTHGLGKIVSKVPRERSVNPLNYTFKPAIVSPKHRWTPPVDYMPVVHWDAVLCEYS